MAVLPTRLAIENWKSKYQYDGESDLGTFVRVAKAIAEVDRAYGADDTEVQRRTEEYLQALVRFDPTVDDDQQYQGSPEQVYVDKFGAPVGLYATPGGRVTANLGTGYEKATAWNCFSGNTKFQTLQGPKTFLETHGSEETVLTKDGWVNAEIRCFGKQPVQRLILQPAKMLQRGESFFWRALGRSNLRKEVVVTPNHRWIRVDGEVTSQVCVGDFLAVHTNRFREDDLSFQNETYRDGFRHGMIYGDGYVNGRQRSSITFGIRLCGAKSKFTDLWENVTYPPSYGGDPFCSLTTDLDTNLKAPPQSGDPIYIRGFVDGWAATDGCVLESGNVEISSQDHAAMQWLQEVATQVGLFVVGFRQDANVETNFGTRSAPLQRVILSTDEHAWKVVSVEDLGREELVYCAVVPDIHAFTLSDGLYTGNCFINSPVTGATIKYQKRVPNSDQVIDCEISSEQTPDNLTNIFLSLLEAAETLKSEGGYGINFGFIRPRGTLIQGVGIRHPGVVSYMELWDKMSSMIVKGDNDGYHDNIVNHLKDETKENLEKAQPRKGAMMAVLPIWHPDIEEFIRAKQESGRLTKFNISVLIDDAFMHAVARDDFYSLHFNGEIYKKVRAKDLYDLIMESTFSRNEPGVLFFDNMNRRNPLIYLGPVTASNPCGEIPGASFMDQHYQPADYLVPYMENQDRHLIGFTTVCLLASLNLPQFVGTDRSFDFEKYAEVVAQVARMLENINDTGVVPLPAYEWAVQNIRQYGMGINGLGSALYMMGIRYGSPEAVEFVDKIHQIKDDVSLRVSALLAKDRGPFPMYDERYLETPYFRDICTASDETKDLVRQYGARNAKRLTNPPLGNSSVICGSVSNGIEPVFSWSYDRVIISDEWPEGLTRENVKDLFEEVKMGDSTVWRGEFAGRRWHYEPHNRGLCFIDEVRDFGYDWVMKHFPDDFERGEDYLVTAQDLQALDHVRMQAKVQESCDQAVSKCLAEGQWVETNFGPMPIEECLAEEPSNPDSWIPAKAGLQVYNSHGELVSVTRAYYGGEKPIVQIRTQQGHEVSCSTEHMFQTQRGWVRASQLTEDDFIFKAPMNYQHGPGEAPLFFNVEELGLHYYKPVTIPTHMSVELAEILGMIAADGHIRRNCFAITEGNQAVGDRFKDLCRSVFNYEPGTTVDTRNGGGTRTHMVSSTPLSALLQTLLGGRSSFDKAVPAAILKGSREEKLAFLSGVSLDGYALQKRGAFCLYDGCSSRLSQGVTTLARQLFGTDVYVGSKITETAHRSFGVRVYAAEGLNPPESHKMAFLSEVRSRDDLVLVSAEDIGALTRNPKAQNYNSVRSLQQRLPTFIRRSTAEKHGLPFREGSFVASVNDGGTSPTYDLEVDSDEHVYLVDGLVTHNTCNIPNDYPFDEFKNIYFEAWKAGLVGFTTYRDGTMEAVLEASGHKVGNMGSLLMSLRDHGCTSEDAEVTPEGVIVRDVHLPEHFVNGPTATVRREGHKYYLHLSYLPNDPVNPVALWIHSNSQQEGEFVTLNRAFKAVVSLLRRAGVDNDLVDSQVAKNQNEAHHVRLGKIISMALRHNVSVPRIVAALSNIEGDYIATTLTAVRKYLMGQIQDGAKALGMVCPACESTDIVFESGCSTCRACGNSGC